jgi:glutamate racemase
VATTILVFDSGLGGLTVFREVAKARPDARYLYIADDAFFPYGGHGEAELVARVGDLIGELIEAHRPDLIVIACNTASTLVLPHLRTRFRVPFVGTVPAIKPACAVSRTKRVAVLGTQATVSREYTHALIRDFANGSDVALVGGRTAHRHDRARLHALSAAARPIRTAFALAGDLRRSRPGDRAPCRRFARRRSERRAAIGRAHRVHLRPGALGRARRGAGAFRHRARI